MTFWKLFRAGFLSFALCVSFHDVYANDYSQNAKLSIETIVFMRHGEKPEIDIGQLNCQGLNRSLKLPEVLLEKFGKPNYLFAPNPSVQKPNKQTGVMYNYLRGLTALQPLATQLGMNIDISYGYSDDKNMAKELLRNKYKNSVVFVAWSHKEIVDIANRIYDLAPGNNGTTVPKWSKNDFDSLYIFEVKRNGDNEIIQMSFQIDFENLNGLSERCPT